MVSSRDTEERPSLSVILPQLYLGAERDVTQERLASLGISYVLSVNRCSPQPSFLPRSRYLRIPIDDSLWDDLLPWIPQALHFIDAAMSSGESVLVHCAAGISRSPAVAVAYIMHSLGMDLDHAYRFVKERRPSISPNFNFLGQLQHFQGTLRQKVSGGDISIQQLDNRLSPIDDSVEHADISHNMNHQADSVSGDSAHREDYHPSDQTQKRHSQSGKLQTLHLTLSHIQQQVQMPCEPLTPVTPAVTPTQLHFPGGSASLVEKRKRLTLLLTPLEMCPPSSQPARDMTTSRSVHSRGTVGQPEAKTQSGAGEAKEQGLLSPFSFTLNKLLGWGERVLLGGLLVHPVRMGQPALPYRC